MVFSSLTSKKGVSMVDVLGIITIMTAFFTMLKVIVDFLTASFELSEKVSNKRKKQQ